MVIASCSPSYRKKEQPPKEAEARESQNEEEDEEDENVQHLEQCARLYKCLEVCLTVLFSSPQIESCQSIKLQSQIRHSVSTPEVVSSSQFQILEQIRYPELNSGSTFGAFAIFPNW